MPGQYRFISLSGTEQQVMKKMQLLQRLAAEGKIDIKFAAAFNQTQTALTYNGMFYVPADSTKELESLADGVVINRMEAVTHATYTFSIGPFDTSKWEDVRDTKQFIEGTCNQYTRGDGGISIRLQDLVRQCGLDGLPPNARKIDGAVLGIDGEISGLVDDTLYMINQIRRNPRQLEVVEKNLEFYRMERVR